MVEKLNFQEWNNYGDEKVVSIIITLFNSENTIIRTIKSLEMQSNKNFECIIMDDGSTDSSQEVLFGYLENTDLSVRYFRHENVGVTRNRYLAACEARTKLILELDSDDEFVEDTVELFINHWNSFTAEQRIEYSGICALSLDSSSGKIDGDKFPSNINELPFKNYFDYRTKGERIALSKTNSYIEKYQYGIQLMEENDLIRVSESLMHYKSELESRLFCINEVLRIYHTETCESLTRGKSLKIDSIKVAYFSRKKMLNTKIPNENISLKKVVVSAMYYIKFGKLLGYSLKKLLGQVDGRVNKTIFILMIPFGLGNYVLGRKVSEEE